MAMKLVIVSVLMVAIAPASALAGQRCGSKAKVHGDAKVVKASYESGKDIVDTASSTGTFKTLVAAIQAAGLVGTLKGDGPFTVFAPTDAAFAKLPDGTVENLLKPENRDKLVKILTYHVVPGKVLAKDVVNLKTARTVQGRDVHISAGKGVKVNDANVVATDVMTSNGVIHVIDTVLMPSH